MTNTIQGDHFTKTFTSVNPDFGIDAPAKEIFFDTPTNTKFSDGNMDNYIAIQAIGRIYSSYDLEGNFIESGRLPLKPSNISICRDGEILSYEDNKEEYDEIIRTH